MGIPRVINIVCWYKPFDVHTWSEHPEVDAFINPIYEEHFAGRKAAIRKKHLKVLLLDLYVSWTEDPTLKIAVSRNVNDYQAGSRYNELHISKLTIDVIDALANAGLINQAIGFLDREKNIGRHSRIWPTDELVEMFVNARFTPLDLANSPDRLTVVLRGEDPRGGNKETNKEYDPTPDTDRMSDVLRRYNNFLRETFIDIPTLEQSFIPRDGDGNGQGLIVSQRDKFVRRIFNRDSFDCGGRFYGGWWQRCPKEFRQRIFINDEPTSEVDFSGLHIVLLYAQMGVPYWEAIGNDPYRIEPLDFVPNEADNRQLAKQLMLILINSKSANAAFAAFRDQTPMGDWRKNLTNAQLDQVAQSLANLHPDIADRFGADAGIHLQYTDSNISERIIDNFTEQGIPVLCIHDSYIVPSGFEDGLIDAMSTAL